MNFLLPLLCYFWIFVLGGVLGGFIVRRCPPALVPVAAEVAPLRRECDRCDGEGYYYQIGVRVQCSRCRGYGTLPVPATPRMAVLEEEDNDPLCQAHAVRGVK